MKHNSYPNMNKIIFQKEDGNAHRKTITFKNIYVCYGLSPSSNPGQPIRSKKAMPSIIISIFLSKPYISRANRVCTTAEQCTEICSLEY
jgi:hypothetical protein